MDAGRFDALSKSLASRRSRRSLGAGGLAAGLLAALGVEHAGAATKACSLAILATTATGKHKNKTYAGTLKLQIGDQGAIDQGSFTLADGQTHPLIGQATGRALNLRITLADQTILALDGTAENDLILCRGAASGTFGGPSDTDLGAWRTVEGTGAGTGTTSGGSTGNSSAGGNSGGDTGGGATNGNGGGTAPTPTPDGGGGATTGGGGTDCPSGVVCGGVCCAGAPGLTPDSIVCNAGACECAYSCQAAGCPGNAQASIVNTCGSDPEPHCHSECNAPADNGCGDLTCDPGQTLDVDACTCVDDAAGGGGGDCGGADLLHDPNNCGFCGVVCGSGFCQNGVCPDTDPCPAEGRTNCNNLCVDTQSDAANCGGCGVICQGGFTCTNGACDEIIH